MSSQYHGGGFGPWRCGSGRRVLTAGVGRAGPAVFGGWGARCFFFFYIWGLAAKEWESLVPAYNSSSIFCEKLRSGDVGERDNLSDERCSGSGVAGGCEMLPWLPWLFSRKSSLGAESWSCCSTCCRLSRDVHEQWLFWLHGVISVLVVCVNHMMTLKLI